MLKLLRRNVYNEIDLFVQTEADQLLTSQNCGKTAPTHATTNK